jgi:M6 family metalloprotease-like protein
MGAARAVVIVAILIGSQALPGLAPLALASPKVERAGLAPSRAARPGSPRLLATRPPGGANSTSAALLQRRRERARSFPHRVGGVRRNAWISGGKAPLLAPSLTTGQLQRTTPFAGVPDTVRVLGLRVDFQTDRLGTQTTTLDGRFDLRSDTTLAIPVDPPPHNREFFLSHLEALSRYWRFTSYGNLVIEYDVYPKNDTLTYRLGDTGDYGPWTLGQQSYDEAVRFFKDAVRKADQTDSIPFGDFDVVTVFHSGSDYQTDLAGDSPRDFPTFQLTLDNDSVLVNNGAVALFGGMVMPETENQDGYFSALNGTLGHEFGHTQGLPDLYDVNTFFPAVGIWSNMDSGYLLATLIQDQKTGQISEASGVLPTSLDPWCKINLWPDKLQFVDPGRTFSGHIRATELRDSLLYVPLGGDEYYLVENREADLNRDNTVYLDRDSTTHVILGPGLSSADPTDSLGDKEYDFLLPGEGMLVWHIDDTVIFGPNVNPDYGINSNPERRGVAVVEADGINDIGDPNSRYFFGSPYDPYFVGNHTRLAPDTSPSTKTNSGAQSHVEITIGSPPGVSMDIQIQSDWRAQGWPVVSQFGLSGDPPTFGSLLHDGNRNVVSSADSLIFAWMSDGTPYLRNNSDGLFAALPAPIVPPVLFADSLFRQDPASAHGSAVIATATDGKVYAFRAGSRDSSQAIPLTGWPPSLGAGIDVTTAPVLSPFGAVLVGASDGRIVAIGGPDRADFPPLVGDISDTLVVGSTPVIFPVVGNLAVGRFRGPPGGYYVAYALSNGVVRVVSPLGKDPTPTDLHWNVGSAPFRAYLLGVDLDRAADGNLELIVVDHGKGVVHALDLTGTELPGWPVTVIAGLHGAAAAGDLDGDGYPEVFAVDDQGFVHRWNRNGVEPAGWPVSLTARYGADALGGTGSPAVGDVDHDGASELVIAATNGIVTALEQDGRAVPGWPVASQPGDELSPLLLSLNDVLNPPNPPGTAWEHVIVAGGDGLWNAFQVGARADSAFATPDGTSERSPWIGYGGNRRRSSVMDDADLRPVVALPTALAQGSLYCYPNPARGADVGVAYTLGDGVGAVDIRILDPLGNEVRRQSGPTSPAGNVARIPVRDLASGVYLVRLEVKRGGSTEVAFRKFAVVR